MRVAIFGGWDEDPVRNDEWKVRADERSREQLAEAAREIGRRLARRGHTVVVGSEKRNSADHYVVEAMLGELGGAGGPPRIEVIEQVESSGPLYRAERDGGRGRLFKSINPRWSGRPIRSAEKILAVQKADAVITAGGLTDTWTGGIAAVVARKPVVPLGTFGGASLQLLQALKGLDHALKGKDNEEKFELLENFVWDPSLVDTIFDLGGLDGDRVFFAYSGKARPIAEEIIGHLRARGLRVENWATDFRVGGLILDGVHAGISAAKYGIFLFTPDEPGGGAGQQGIPRDNVLFEAGYFMGAHGRERTIVIVQEGAKVLADYGGHIYISFKGEGDLASVKEGLHRALGLGPLAEG